MSKNALMHELDAENVWRPVRGTGGANSANSSSANIGISGVFTGTGVDVSQYGTISVSVQASHSSATNGLVFQGSFDNTTWFDMESYTYTASDIKIYSMAPAGKYFRVKYTNGGSATTAFNLLTTFTNAYTKPSSHRVGDNITAENDAELSKSVLAAKKPDGAYTNIDCTTGGNLKVSIEEIDEAVSVRNALTLKDISPPLDNGVAYASGDVLFIPVAVSVAADNGKHALLHSLSIIDKDDNGGALDLVFLSGTAASFGAINTPVAIDDTDATKILGIISLTSASYYDIGASKIATLSNIGLTLKAEAASTNIYVAGISKDTKTYTTSGLVIRIGIAAQD